MDTKNPPHISTSQKNDTVKNKIQLIILLLTATCATVFGQVQIETPAVTPPAEQPKPKDKIEELRLKLNDDGSHYIKATFSNQVWFRFNDSNPGTTVLGDPAKQTFDIGLRRTRVQLYGQLTDHVTFYFQFGQNNFNFLTQNAGNRKMEVFFHDALAEYKISKKSDILFLGGGLTIANGLSRFSQPSISTIMTMDVPVFAQATVDQTDEFSRKLSIYARGQVGRLDYRLVMSDPFPVNTNGTSSVNVATPAGGAVGVFPSNPVTTVTYPTSVNSAFAQTGHNKQYQGFFMWNFFDKESHVTPYMTGTYLGKKKVLNLEAGFISQQNAVWTITDPNVVSGANNFTYHAMNLWSAAIFYDAPVNTEKGTAINFYGGYFHTDYGPGYLRYNGIMNPASGIAAPATGTPQPGSQGNAFPMFGTGSVAYAQFGYLLKKDLLGEGNGTLMPYASVQSANYDRLDKQMTVFDLGLNWLIKGHSSKITLDYQNRPVYTPNGAELNMNSSRKGQVVMQYQIFF